jgi:peptide/nickel transport system substrate-binding protein
MPVLTKSRIVAQGIAILALFATTVPTLADEIIRVASPYPTTTLDPMRSAAAGNIETYGQLYSRLLRRNPESGALEPGLAESWEISADGLTYTFKLRDAKFSDGSAISADDVAFSLERVRTDKQSAYPAPLSAVESVTAADPNALSR